MEIIFGRKVDGKDARNVDCKVVSARHCRIWLDEGTNTYYIEDLDSTNGTYVNGVLIKRKALQPNDKILLGGDGGYATTLQQILAEGKQEEKQGVGHNIENLKVIYKEYQRDMAKFKSRTQIYSSMRIVPSMLISGLGVVLAVNDRGILAIASLVAVVLCLIVSSVLIRKTDAKMKERVTRFQLTYVCPKTRRFYGDKSWEVLQNEGVCLHCKEKFE